MHILHRIALLLGSAALLAAPSAQALHFRGATGAWHVISATPSALRPATSRVSRRAVIQRAQQQVVRIPLQSSRSSSSSSSRSSTASWNGKPRPLDPLPAAPVRSGFLLLGETSMPIAGVRFFSTSEPISASKIIVQLSADAPAVDSILVYDESQRLLGTATKDSGTAGRYSAMLPTGLFSLPHKQSISLYLRARCKPYHLGGESGQTVQVSTVSIEGTGDWSNSDYVQSSTDTFPGFETARGVPTIIRSAGPVDSVLSSGSHQLLSSFRFESKATDGQARVALTQLRFTIESSGNVTLSNVALQSDASDDSMNCSVSAGLVTCSAIPASLGVFDSPRVLRVYGDVTVAAGAINPFLRLTINNPGTVSGSGDVTWTDGEASHTWVPFEQPVARGTMMR